MPLLLKYFPSRVVKIKLIHQSRLEGLIEFNAALHLRPSALREWKKTRGVLDADIIQLREDLDRADFIVLPSLLLLNKSRSYKEW